MQLFWRFALGGTLPVLGVYLVPGMAGWHPGGWARRGDSLFVSPLSSGVGPEFEKGDGRLRPSLQQRLPGAEGLPGGMHNRSTPRRLRRSCPRYLEH